MKSAVISIGTELTTGQIVNRNSSWISEQLKLLGLTTDFHLAVPDDRELIQRALEFCVRDCEIIFVTGGLGPTTDDFTRDVICQWAGNLPLEFHSEAWEHVQSRLTERGYQVHDFQKQQCFFPRGSKPLKNNFGTAYGFQLEHRGCTLFALPGPPREVEAVWSTWISPWLQEKVNHIDPLMTRSWDVLGLGESEVAMKAEPLLVGIPHLEKGYRVHLPYVEFKLSYLKSEEEKLLPVFASIENALQSWTMFRNGEDVCKILAKKIENLSSFSVQDEVTGSHLLSRLQPVLRNYLAKMKFHYSNKLEENNFENSQNTLFIKSTGEFTIEVTWSSEKMQKTKSFETPLKSSFLKERRPQYFAEVALAFLAQSL